MPITKPHQFVSQLQHISLNDWRALLLLNPEFLHPLAFSRIEQWAPLESFLSWTLKVVWMVVTRSSTPSSVGSIFFFVPPSLSLKCYRAMKEISKLSVSLLFYTAVMGECWNKDLSQQQSHSKGRTTLLRCLTLIVTRHYMSKITWLRWFSIFTFIK